MPAKKKSKSLTEKAKEVAEEITEEIGEAFEKAEDAIEEAVENLSSDEKKTTTTKKTIKKTVKKATKKASDNEDKEDKFAKLKEKAEKLAKGIKTDETSLKKSKEDEEKYNLAQIEDYLKSSIHLGTRAITPDMKSYVYKRRADSLAVFNTKLLDKKLEEASNYLAKFAPEEVVIVCKREAGHKAVELFSQVTGIKAFTKNYPAGILTNPNLENFMERELMFVCDPWTDKAVMEDARRVKIPVLAICDTNNYTLGVSKVIPGNNKSAKSLGFIFHVLAKLYVEKRKLKTEVPLISEWVENWDNLVPPK